MAIGRRAAAAVAAAAVLLAACGRYDLAGPSTLAEPIAADRRPAASLDEGGAARPRPGDVAKGQRPGPPGAKRLSLTDARPPEPPAPGAPLRDGAPPSVPSVPKDPHRVAVVIGIDDYPGGDDDLRAAAADARLVRRALGRLGFGQVVVLINGRATRGAILWSARWLARQTGPGRLGAFFYAGHVRRVGGDPDGDGEDVDEALLAADGRLVFDGEVAAALSEATGPLWLAWAACYAAGFSDAAAPGRVSSYASEEGSLAYESTALGHSFMAEYLVRRALLRRGLLRVEAMHGYATRHLRGDERRFRPILDDRLPGALRLAPPQPAPEGGPHAQECLVVLRCNDHG